MKVSVILPTYNEARCLGRTLDRLRRLPGDFEFRVVDGGSEDGTVAIASGFGMPVVRAPRGRATQMNIGAELARGDVLLFLHADTLLPTDAHARIARALGDSATAGGCFRLSFDDDSFGLRLSAFLTRFSFSLFHYGDSAYFVRRDVFHDMGGFRRYKIMEDIDFWLRLRRRHRAVILEAPVVTSARRFVRHGVMRQQVRGAVLLLLFLAGVPPDHLKRYYDEVR